MSTYKSTASSDAQKDYSHQFYSIRWEETAINDKLKESSWRMSPQEKQTLPRRQNVLLKKALVIIAYMNPFTIVEKEIGWN